MSRRAAVIGAGLGGLAAGLRLAARGWKVTILEAGPTFGGKMNRWQKDGFTFDTGPSLITMPWVFSDLFASGGSDIEQYVKLVPLDPLAEYVYADGTRFRYSSSLPDWLATMDRVAPEDQDGFFRFLQLGSRLWEVSKRTFLSRTPYDPPRADDWKILRHLPIRYGWGNYGGTVDAHFRSPYLRQLYKRYPTYVGSWYEQSPATLAIIPYLEFAFGGWYVRGGLYRIIEGLLEVCASLGVDLRANARVDQIAVANGRASGVRLHSGEAIPADIVIMNGDAANTRLMLGMPPGRQRSRSLSGLVMLLGVDRELPEMEAHTIFFSADYRREFAQLIEEQRFPDDPTVYVNVPSRLDRSLAPANSETLFVMANAPPRVEEWDDAGIERAKGKVFDRLRKSGFPDLSGSIRVEDCWTPRRIEQCYLMPGGAIYGADSHGWRNAFLRPRNKSRLCEGLYHVGGSTHPGGGTPTVLLSAEITCDLIDRHERG